MNVSIKTKFYMIIIFMIILSLLFAYVISTKIIYENMNSNFRKETKQKQRIFDYTLEGFRTSLEREGKILAGDSNLIKFLKEGYTNDFDKTFSVRNPIAQGAYYEKFTQSFDKRLKGYFKGIDSIAVNIVDRSENYIHQAKVGYYNRRQELNMLFRNITKSEFPLSGFIVDEKNQFFLKTYNPVYNNKNNKILGVIIVSIKVDEGFINYFHKIMSEMEIVFIKRSGSISISTFKKKLKKMSIKLNKDLEVGKDAYRLEKLEIKDMEKRSIGYIILAFSESEVIQGIKEVSAYVFIALFFVFSILFIVSLSSLNLMIDSIKRLTLKINSLKEGNFDTNLSELKNRNDEIGILAQDFEDMIIMLKTKIDLLEKVNEDNRNYAEKLEIANGDLEKTKQELELKNNNIDRINKMMNSRMSEITNMYYFIINISKYIVDDKFNNVIVRGIREGIKIKKVLIMLKEGEYLKQKAKIGLNFEMNDFKIKDDFLKIMEKKDIMGLEDCYHCKNNSQFTKAYVVPLIGNKREFYGLIIVDNESKLDREVKKSLLTYVQMIILAFENRKLYVRLLDENQKMEETAKKLKKSEKMKNIFLSNVSHELKMPLVPIKGYNEMLLGGMLGNLTVMQRKVLITSLNNIKRLEGIIENLVNYSKIEGGAYQCISNKFNLSETIEQVIEQVDNLIEGKNLRVNRKYSDKITASGDKEALKQVFSNILSNSIKFSKNDGEIEIIIKDIPNLNKCRVDIIDYGLGMPKEKISRIFKSFSQLEEGYTRKYNGIGLGLTIAKKIMEYHNEEIQIKSDLDKGTTVSIYLSKS